MNGGKAMQINRLFEIIYILLDKKTVTAAELAERFEVSARTIYRDIEALSEAGIPVFMSKGRGGGISFLPDFVLNKAVLTERERTDLLSAIKAVRAVDLSGGDDTLEKVSTMLGSRNADWIEVDFSSWGNMRAEAESFKALKNAVIEKRAVEFIYSSGRAEKTRRAVLPLKLVFKSAAWYLYGFCRLRSDYRFFKLRRIEDIIITDEHFEMSAPETIPTDFMDTSRYILAEMIISKNMAFRVYDEVRDYSLLENGDFLCKVRFPDINTICSYVSTFGEHCRLTAPADAVAELKKRLKKIAEVYF